MRLKVIHIINSLEVGGGEILLSNSLSKGGLPEYIDNVLITLGGNDPLIDRIDPRVKVYSLRYKGYWQLPFLLTKIYSIFRRENADIIHSHHTPSGLYSRLVTPYRARQVHTLHSMYSVSRATRPILKFLDRKILFSKNSLSLVFLSKMLQHDFLNLVSFKGKTFVLPNFIEDRFFNIVQSADPHPDVFKLVAVGNLRDAKNYGYLLEMFKELRNENITLDIYGDGNQEPFLEIIRNNDLKVRFLGVEKDVSSKLGTYDLFIMSSKYEAYPLSVLEAMAAGIPLYLSDIPSLRDMAGSYANYFELDDPAKAAQDLKKLACNKAYLLETAQKARQYIEQVAKKDVYVRKLLTIYSQIVNLPISVPETTSEFSGQIGG